MDQLNYSLPMRDFGCFFDQDILPSLYFITLMDIKNTLTEGNALDLKKSLNQT